MTEISRLEQLLDYREDSISSKTLVEKEGGSITLYAFDKAQGLGAHTSPAITGIQIVEGKAEISIEGETSLISEGEYVTIPKDTVFGIHSIQKVKALITRIHS